MKKHLDKYKIESLLNAKSELDDLVTIYMPVNPLETEINELRLKAHIKSLGNLTEALEDKLNSLRIERLSHRVVGVCIYLSASEMDLVPVPFTVPSFSVCTHSYFLSPLLVNINQLDHYYFLALSQKKPRLFELSLLNIEECELSEKLRGKLLDKMGIDESNNSLQYHSTGRHIEGGNIVQSATFHGHGDRTNSTESEAVANFFRKLERTLYEFLPEDRKPLILGGVEDKLSMMRKVAKHLEFSDISLSGNFDDENIDKIHDKLIPTLKRVLAIEIKKNEVLDRLDLIHDFGTIVDKASGGAVDSLYIDPAYLVDQFSSNPDYCQIFELAARNTIVNGGDVLGTKNPALKPMGALLRFS